MEVSRFTVRIEIGNMIPSTSKSRESAGRWVG